MNILIPHTWLLEHLNTTATPEEIQKYLSLSGPSVERISDREGEPVYDIEVTTNRVDAMSVRGIAREAAVILHQFGVSAQLRPLVVGRLGALPLATHQTMTSQSTKLIGEGGPRPHSSPAASHLVVSQPHHSQQQAQPEAGGPAPAGNTEHLELPKTFNNPQLCRRVICVALSQVQRTPTPEWMAKRLRQIEMNVHDAVIDITNYITHDLGHPCHAFDYDKLMATGGEIHIVEAQAGETFITLDGNQFTTVGGEVVFKNGRGEIIDLPSIKGTQNTSIDESTQNVLLLMESIRADKVRYASMTHAIRTTAAQLMEKNVDPHLADAVLEEGIALYTNLCYAQVANEIYDIFPGKITPQPITVALSTLDEYLGLELPETQIAQILEQLGCQVTTIAPAATPQNSNNLQVSSRVTQLRITPPTYRPDITIPADVVEEIARIYGYHHLPSKIMDTPIPISAQTGVNFTIENSIKNFLANIGWQEVYTYSLVSEALAVQSGHSLADHLKLQNPLTEDRTYLRHSLIPSLEEVIEQNSSRPELSVFEIANVYKPQPKNNLPKEVMDLALVSTRPYRLVRGHLEALLNRLFVKQHQVVPMHTKHHLYVDGAQLSALNKNGQMIEIGTLGTLKSGRIGISINMSQLLQVVRTHPSYQPLPKTMPLIEDMTFRLPATTSVGEVLTALQNISTLIVKVELKDIYQRNFTLTITYHHPTENLTTEQIAPIREQIPQLVQDQFGGQLIGQV